MMRGNCGRRLSRGNLALILRAGRSGWWIETGTAEPFSTDFRYGFGILGSDDGLTGILGWGKKTGYGHGGQASVH